MFQGLTAIVMAAGLALPGTAFALSGGNDMPDILNKKQPAPELLIGGQPEREELREARGAGIETVINLRGEGEFSEWDEGALVEELGMRYVHIPIAGPDDLNADTLAVFEQALAESDDDPKLVHCASGNRVGAMYALRAAASQGKSTEEALQIGREHGLTQLEPAVREILEAGTLSHEE